MPNLIINVTSIDVHPGGTTGTGTYEKEGSAPGNTSVTDWGDIDIKGHKPNLELEFTLTDDAAADGYTFAVPGFSAIMESPFGPPVTSPPKVCTVPNNNERPRYIYTLHVLNATGEPVDIHPKIINR